MNKNIGKIDSLTANDLGKIAGLLEKQLAPLATKEDIRDMATRTNLKEMEQNLKEYIQEGVENLINSF